MRKVFAVTVAFILGVAIAQDIGAGDNAGSCYDLASGGTDLYCAVEEAACENGPTDNGQQWTAYQTGHVSGFFPGNPAAGCCHCCAGCNLTAEALRRGNESCAPFRAFDGECGHEGGPSEGSPFFAFENSATTYSQSSEMLLAFCSASILVQIALNSIV
uniref:Uncharacterized protein n=1 Tax=Aplanochytrium stocchinoi TaxID=215587 RepID=A0A7S3PSM6_9STRA|mmetsp:Transcript_7392/g.9375  ORF Transcript_7392/g.9375 Transcript_7392/m.9375 type:complete len:159 (+) Transcript_7392:514-990(+)|eukprot:CAMPEP_0204828194 /NCGR_PEP_ID=MMETSP1346-20131115/5849_1 /ASSEMBLY_ACC=CAM_ASM_000771 /TAXON_ID=215587 /ORGANISM="Aplanochytrium stocchinoi, Strain GSBS06" /LENGTH=158 /DNA_ID=CAMNT_0051957073 /DNA_START=141 /DNA_END=617 /DNA_ORIENTATION=-